MSILGRNLSVRKPPIFATAMLMSLAAVVTAFAGQEDHLIFSHMRHVIEMGMDCQTCHAAVGASMHGTDNLLPSMDTCFMCHNSQTAPNKCTICHTHPDQAQVVRPAVNYAPKFPHKTHLDHGIRCLVCHKEIDKATDAAAVHLPKMNQCQDCHRQKRVSDPLTCLVCHSKQQNLKPTTHLLDWKHMHQYLAESNGTACAQCHAQTFCKDCHEGKNLTHETHPLNYEWNHAIDAKVGKTQCISCHEDEVFCIQCHNEMNVMPPSHGRVGWLNTIDGGQHKIEAEIDLETCIACHGDYQSNPTCFRCHNGQNREE